jgi:hypothetical protein
MNPGVLIARAALDGIAFLLGVAFLAALMPGRLRKYTTADGAVVRESIAEWVCVPIGGVPQWMAIRGRDTFGTRSSSSSTAGQARRRRRSSSTSTTLADHFTLVAWEQRVMGSG